MSRRTVDVAFTRAKIAVFLDGCFWHGCPQHFVEPKTNSTFWLSKIAKNRERDLDTTARLENSGWTVVRFWEHEDPDVVTKTIVDLVRKARR